MPQSHRASAPAPVHPATFDDSHYDHGRAVLRDPALFPNNQVRMRSILQVWLGAAFCGVVVFFSALAIQWAIYDRFLHENGIRVVGSAIASVIAIGLVSTLGMRSRRQKMREIQRLETIALLNHHIRNALQAIIACSGTTDSTDVIRHSVERIEWALGEVLPGLSSRENRPPGPPH